MEEASATSGHEIRMIRSKEKRGACEGRRVSLARIEGDGQSGCRGSAISVGRVFRKPSGPPGASLNASPLRPRVVAGTRQKTPLSALQRLGGCTLGEMREELPRPVCPTDQCRVPTSCVWTFEGAYDIMYQ